MSQMVYYSVVRFDWWFWLDYILYRTICVYTNIFREKRRRLKPINSLQCWVEASYSIGVWVRSGQACAHNHPPLFMEVMQFQMLCNVHVQIWKNLIRTVGYSNLELRNTIDIKFLPWNSCDKQAMGRRISPLLSRALCHTLERKGADWNPYNIYIYQYLYISMCIYIYFIYKHLHVCIYFFTYIYIYLHISIHIYVYVCSYLQKYTRISIFVLMCIFRFCSSIDLHAYIHIYISIYLYRFTYIHIYNTCVYMCIYMYIYIYCILFKRYLIYIHVYIYINIWKHSFLFLHIICLKQLVAGGPPEQWRPQRGNAKGIGSWKRESLEMNSGQKA